MLSYIGAFPFLQDAPAVLGLEEMIIVITIMTERYRRVLAKGDADRRKLLYKSLAIYDRLLSEMAVEGKKADSQPGGAGADKKNTGANGFAVDQAGEEEDEDEDRGYIMDDDDGLVLAAFESLDYVDAFQHGNAPPIHGAMIPADNFRKLIMLLLLITPLEPQERL